MSGRGVGVGDRKKRRGSVGRRDKHTQRQEEREKGG